MPFKSQAQMRAAFAGGLGPEMKKKASMWAKETPDIKDMPMHVKGDKGKKGSFMAMVINAKPKKGKGKK